MNRNRLHVLVFAAIVALLAACGGEGPVDPVDPAEDPTVTVNVTGDGTGTVTVNGDAYTEPVTVESGSEVEIVATPADAATTVTWTGACEGAVADDTCTLDVTEDITVGVEFDAPGDGGDGGDADGTVNALIATTTDDAEEFVTGANTDNAYNAAGAVVTNTQYLDFGYDSNFEDEVIVGLRFDDVAIPAGATITDAYVQFTAAASEGEAVTFQVAGQLAVNPDTFADTGDPGGTVNGITERVGPSSPTASVTPGAWTAGARTAAERFTGLESVVQAIVDQEGWSESDNAVVLVVERTAGAAGSGRQAYDFRHSDDGGASAPPELVVEYTVGAG